MNYKYGFNTPVNDYGSYLLTEQLEGNLTSWLSWGLLSIGAFENITKNQEAVYGGDKSRLRPVNDPRITSTSTTSKIWQANRPDWCWETGIYNSTQPIDISGVWINNSFYPTTGIVNHHYINYPLGQVVFNSGIPVTSVVQIEYSPRFVTVRRSDEPWFQSILKGSLRVDDPQFSTNSPSGQWSILAENRLVLPALVVEPTYKTNTRPYELGNASRIHKEDFLVHIISETPWDKKRLSSLLINQKDKGIPTFDRNQVDPPLDYYGRPTASAMIYPDMCEASPWNALRISDVYISDSDPIGNKIWWSTARLTLEVDAPN